MRSLTKRYSFNKGAVKFVSFSIERCSYNFNRRTRKSEYLKKNVFYFWELENFAADLFVKLDI